MIKKALLLFFAINCILLALPRAEAAIHDQDIVTAKPDPLVAEYEKFTVLADEEKAKLGKSIHAVWGDRLLSTNRRWVSYMDNNSVRAHYQFGTETLTLEFIVDSSFKGKDTSIINPMMRRYLRRFMMEDFQSIYEEGPLAAAERRMVADGANIVTAELPDITLVQLLDGSGAKDISVPVDRIVNGVIANGERSVRPSPVAGKAILSVSAKVKAEGVDAQREKYKLSIDRYAETFEGERELIHAIAFVESEMNPLARSGAEAFGIMQVVPKTAGIEISKRLFGEPLLLSPSYFFNVERNIEAGVTYLSILYNNYFKDVADPDSRMYCVISAYNTGPSNVARAFVGEKSISKAVVKINTMTAQEVYDHLILKLPYKETRTYLENVTAAAK